MLKSWLGLFKEEFMFKRLAKLGLMLLVINTSYACNSATQVFCEIGHGLMLAESQGKNGLMLSGYAYHTSIPAHWPAGSSDNNVSNPIGLNEFPYGIGYSRSWYNDASHEEYMLIAIAFADSYWKPELHIGYTYQKFHPILNSDNLEWGLGYTPMLLVKPSWSNDAPAILPGVGLTTSLRYKSVELMATWVNVIFVNAKIDF